MSQEEIVAELGLSREDVMVLRWILHCWLKQYLANEGSALKTRAIALINALEEVDL